MLFVKMNIFVKLLFLVPVVVKCKEIVHGDNICGENKRVYVELGEGGMLTARNVSYPGYNKIENNKIDLFKNCRLELIVCPACVVVINFIFLNISSSCNNNARSNTCPCDYVWIYEPSFEEVSGQEFCGSYLNDTHSSLLYKSKTRAVSLTFFYKQPYQHAFDIEYRSERNREVIETSPTYILPNNANKTYFITTPYFPYPYPRDLMSEYIFRCVNQCRILLTFDDFLIAKMSVVEIFDSNGKIIDVATGLLFRPAAVISSGSSLTIRFFANGASAEGFNAAVSFLQTGILFKPNMNCGGLVDNFGGGITMMNVIKESTETFDCIWILHPSRNYLHSYTHLKLSTVVFSNFVGNAELIIRVGSTSFGKRLETLRYYSFGSILSKQQEHIVPISEGFYIKFQGIFKPDSKLGVAYTAFSYNGIVDLSGSFLDCVAETDFSCKNLRCIPIYLQCDGFDHCGDNSDEPSSCFQDLKQRRWTTSSKFFFQKPDSYSELPVAAMVFIICCFVVGLISLLLALIILIFRVNGRTRHQREMENHMQVVNDLLDQEIPALEEEIMFEDEPPVYENPPTYEELNKYKFQVSENQRSSSKKLGRRKRSTIKRSALSQTENERTPDLSKTPDSPPPAYAESNFGSTQVLIPETCTPLPGTSSQGVQDFQAPQKSNSETLQSFFIIRKFVKSEEFILSKKKILQRSKKWNKLNKINGESRKSGVNINRWLSDSDISEIRSEDQDVSRDCNAARKIQRSFSFDNL